MATDALIDQVKYYLNQLRQARRSEDAFHSLLELGPAAVPLVMEAFRKEDDPELRRTLVEIGWRARCPMSLEFMKEALGDPEKVVWNAAITGLYSNPSAESASIIASTLTCCSVEKSEYLAEALGVIKEQLRSSERSDEYRRS